MFEEKMTSRTILLAAVLIITCAGFSHAQDLTPAPDPIEQLRLAPEQRQRIRMILAENKDERQSINRRVREANVLLDQALDTDPTNETVIEQRINELAAAQAAGADVYVTSDLRHHPVSEHSERVGACAVIDVPHWAAEWTWLPVAAQALEERLGDTVEITVSTIVTDPWTFAVPSRGANAES